MADHIGTARKAAGKARDHLDVSEEWSKTQELGDGLTAHDTEHAHAFALAEAELAIAEALIAIHDVIVAKK